ncbi:hypothetical protein [Nocardioides dongkuii]|uniref:hypothetical protein n=1 Tax=Nocardioides dongkuii TaxID=2760089 RepID=UPI0015FC2772|nr:hypothetical protein [Nocardioides dongkuii]
MTTQSTRSSPRSRRSGGAVILLGAGLGALAVGLLGAAAGALFGGAQAALGALVGAALGVGVLAFGAATVHVVAGLLPSASLLVALMTYALQLLLVLVVLAALDDSAVMGETLSREWLAGSLIVSVLAWVVAQVVMATRVRIPTYDDPSTTGRAGGES